MNILLDAHLHPEITEKYMLLELDSVLLPGKDTPTTAYCLIEKLSIEEMFQIEQWCNLHKNFMKNYRLRNWNYCVQALDHLTGRWQGELDSFYSTMRSRIDGFIENDPGSEWSGVLDRRSTTA